MQRSRKGPRLPPPRRAPDATAYRMDALPLPAPGSVDAEVEDARSEASGVGALLPAGIPGLVGSEAIYDGADTTRRLAGRVVASVLGYIFARGVGPGGQAVRCTVNVECACT